MRIVDTNIIFNNIKINKNNNQNNYKKNFSNVLKEEKSKNKSDEIISNISRLKDEKLYSSFMTNYIKSVISNKYPKEVKE